MLTVIDRGTKVGEASWPLFVDCRAMNANIPHTPAEIPYFPLLVQEMPKVWKEVPPFHTLFFCPTIWDGAGCEL